MPEWAREILHWAALLSPALLILSLLLPAGFPFRKRRWAILAFGLIVIQLLAYQFGTMMVAGFTGLVIVAGAIVFLVFGWRQSLRMHAAWLKQMRAEAPVALQAPFEGPWKASGTGPWAARNHHLAASDQWYATDWVRVEGDARGSKVLAPVDGVVALVEDWHPDKPARRWIQRDLENPAGNYVSLRVHGREGVFVILAHLEFASIAVKEGQTVRAGDLIGRCGNSGNTTVSHLHVHAQPAKRVAPGSVMGIPTVYGGRAEWMQPGEVLEGARSSAAVDAVRS
ncbi:MAG: M23 family metallopeptidase [Terracidiphilus sp.]